MSHSSDETAGPEFLLICADHRGGVRLRESEDHVHGKDEVPSRPRAGQELPEGPLGTGRRFHQHVVVDVVQAQAALGRPPLDLVLGESRREEGCDQFGQEGVAWAEAPRLWGLEDPYPRQAVESIEGDSGLLGQLLAVNLRVTCGILGPSSRGGLDQGAALSRRRRKDPADLTRAPRARTRSANRASEVTTMMDAGAGSSDTIRTISWSAAFRPRHGAKATVTAP